MRKNIIVYLFFNFLFGSYQETFDNLLLMSPFTINNGAIFNNGIKNTFGQVNLNGNVLLNSNTINIGNDSNNTIMIFNGLPTVSTDATIPLKYLMIGENSNQIYIGNPTSSIPAPDYIPIDNLVCDTIIANSSINELTFNNKYNTDIIIGNKNTKVVLSANTIYFNNNEFNNNLSIKTTPFLVFECPIIFTDSVTFSNININGNLNCINTSPINIITKSIEYNSLLLSNDVIIGQNDLSGNITFNGLFSGISNNIIIGTSENLIHKVNNLPIILDMKNFLYCINDSNKNNIFVTDLLGLNETIDIFFANTIKVNYINNNNSATTIFQSKDFILLGTVLINADFQLKNVLFQNKIFFNSVSINENIPFYFVGEKNIIITENNTLTINNSIVNNIFFFSETNIGNNLNIATENIKYLSIDTNGKICIYPMSSKILEIKNDITSIQNIIKTIENNKDIIKNDIKKKKEINQKIKKIIKLLSLHD